MLPVDMRFSDPATLKATSNVTTKNFKLPIKDETQPTKQKHNILIRKKKTTLVCLRIFPIC